MKIEVAKQVGRDEVLRDILDFIKWLRARRDAPTITTLGMIEAEIDRRWPIEKMPS
jgi:hypothetical protein